MSVGMYVDYLLLVLPFCVGVNTDRIKTRKNASKPDIAQMALNLLFLALVIDFGSSKSSYLHANLADDTDKRPHTKLDFLSLLEILHTIKSTSIVCTAVIVTAASVQ